jgi:opacity protein-like surface antigen
MQNCKTLARAVTVAISSVLIQPSVSHAADLGGYRDAAKQEAYQPRDSYQTQYVPHRQFYVRGDVGVGQHHFGGFSQGDLTENGGTFASQSIGDSTFIGAGFGWQLNSRFRLDFTGEYRSTADVKALDNLVGSLSAPDGLLQANTQYNGHMTAIVGLANGYWDITNWRGFTPYLGAGVGFAHVKTSNFTTQSNALFTDVATGDEVTQSSNGYSGSKSQTNFAWALMAGTSYDLSSNAKLDIGYRYLNLGSGVSASTDMLNCTCGTIGAPLKISDLESHEFKIGVRWMLGNEPAPAPATYQPLK